MTKATNRTHNILLARLSVYEAQIVKQLNRMTSEVPTCATNLNGTFVENTSRIYVVNRLLDAGQAFGYHPAAMRKLALDWLVGSAQSSTEWCDPVKQLKVRYEHRELADLLDTVLREGSE